VTETAVAQGAREAAPAERDGARGRQVAWLGKVAFAASSLFAAQLYLSPGSWFPVLEPLHLPMVLSMLSLSALVLQRLLTNRPIWMGVRTAFLAAYVIEALLSPLWSMAPETSWTAATEVVKHMLFFLAITNTANTPWRIRIALFGFALAAIVPACGTYWNYSHQELLVEGFRGRWLGILADPNHDAMALVAAVPILLTLAMYGRRVILKAVAAFGVLACIAGVVATHSRGGSVGLAAALVTWALLSRYRLASLGTAALLAVAVVLYAPSTFWQRNETIAEYRDDESVRGRMRAWHVAGRIAEEHPFLGAGEQGFLAAWEHYAPIDAGPHRFVAHNLFLEVVGNLGFIGLFSLTGFLVCAFWSCWRARNGPLGNEARAVLAALAGYIVCQQFSGYSLSWFTYGLCAFAACIDHWVPRPQPEHRPVGLMLKSSALAA
jgi:putative inorganic carbon (hco3(-)) transporter